MNLNDFHNALEEICEENLVDYSVTDTISGVNVNFSIECDHKINAYYPYKTVENNVIVNTTYENIQERISQMVKNYWDELELDWDNDR